ncbi:MAG: helix-turn-helix transcriptional regulator [Ethanoligenens sp.]
MNKDFPRVLTLLRKEMGISQKKAAGELWISQALLSHYEKGIRECGLEFVVRAADFYGVSCDYLLGRSPDRTGVMLSVEDLPEPDAAGKDNKFRGSLLPTLNKKLMENSLNIVYDMLQCAGSRELTVVASDFLFLAVYTVFRGLYHANNKNPDGLFAINKSQFTQLTSAAMVLDKMQLFNILHGKSCPGVAPFKDAEKLTLSPEKIAQEYPLFSTSLTNLVKNVENTMEKQFSSFL